MKLLGSMTEEAHRKALHSSRERLERTESGQRLLAVVRTLAPDFTSIYVISHLPEQGEDIYRVLIDAKTILGFELDRSDPDRPCDVSVMSVEEFEKTIRQPERIKLAVALDLSSQELRPSAERDPR